MQRQQHIGVCVCADQLVCEPIQQQHPHHPSPSAPLFVPAEIVGRTK